MTIPARLSIVTIGARDVAVLRRFYLALGWHEQPISDDGYAAFILGGAMLALYPVDRLAEEAAPGEPAPTGWNGITLACNVDSKDAVDTAFAAAVAAGARAIGEPTDRPVLGRPQRLHRRPGGPPLGDRPGRRRRVRRTRRPCFFRLTN